MPVIMRDCNPATCRMAAIGKVQQGVLPGFDVNR
jgi:hypothetical protein